MHPRQSDVAKSIPLGKHFFFNLEKLKKKNHQFHCKNQSVYKSCERDEEQRKWVYMNQKNIVEKTDTDNMRRVRQERFKR